MFGGKGLNTGEIILNVVLAVGFSALITTVAIVVPNYDRIRVFERSRIVELEGRAQRTASNLKAIAGLNDDQRDSVDSVLEVTLAE
jgi:hypothetical protein